MKTLSTLLLGASLVVSTVLLAKNPNCKCETCHCTKENHCGCMDETPVMPIMIIL